MKNLATKINCKSRGEVVIGKSSENYISVQVGWSRFFDSFEILDATFDNLFSTKSSFPCFVENGLKVDLLEKKPTIQKRSNY